MKEDFEGFVKYVEAMVEAGCPVDIHDLRNLAKKYETPESCDEGCYLFAFTCETRTGDGLCDRAYKALTHFDDAGPRVRFPK